MERMGGVTAKAVILVVDDQPMNLALIKNVLHKDYCVITAESGQQAMALARGTPRPDLVLLDIMMPDMDGYEVLARLRKDPLSRDIPVVFVTAMTEEEDESQGLGLGAIDYLTKPLRMPILLARVRNHLELKHVRDLLRTRNESLEAAVLKRTRNLHVALEEQKELNNRLEEAQNHLLQSDKLASLGQMAAGVAHEINNPIGFVNSNMGSLNGHVKDLMAILRASESASLQAAGTPEYANYLRLKREKDFDYLCDDLFSIIKESKEGLERVRQIVMDLKAFSRTGDVTLEWADLHACLESTLNIIANEIKYKCSVIKQFDPALPNVHCIPSQLNQVFMNLLVNAAQSIEGKGEIVISTAREGDDRVILRIRDTGKGIPEENLKRIFDPFFTTKPVGQGTGLGLSITWGIIKRHGGTISVESSLGQGTCFTISLPVAHSSLDSPQEKTLSA